MKYVALAFVLLLSAAEAVGAGPAVPTRQEVSEAVRRESDAFGEAIRQYQWKSRTVTTFQGSKDNWPSVSFRCRHNPTCNLMVTTQAAADGHQPDRAVAVNSKYAFELRRAPGKGWAVEKFHRIEPGTELPNVFRLRSTADPVARMASPYWLAEMYWLPDMLSRDSFKVLRIERVQASGGPRVLVRYEFPDEARVGMVYSGTVTLDPDSRWVVTEFDHRSTIKAVTKRTVRTNQFAAGPDGLLLLKESRTIVTSDLPSAAGVTREDVSTFTFTRGAADDAEFTLTAFGLPEPPGVTWEKPTPRYIWFIMAAGGFAVLMLGFRYLARRRATKSPAPA